MITNTASGDFPRTPNCRLSPPASAPAPPGQTGIKTRLLLIFVCLAGLFLPPLAAQAQSNLLALASTPGEYIGQGNTYITTNTADFPLTNVYGIFNSSAAGVYAMAFGYFFNFLPPAGQSLKIGTYSNTVFYSYLNTSNAVLAVSGNHRYCADLSGTLSILEFHTNNLGRVDRLWLTFTAACDPGSPILTGQIRLNSQLAPPDDFVPKTCHVPGDFPTIQSALAAINGVITNTILVSNGVYFENLNFLGKVVNLISVNGPALTIIDGGQSGPVVSFTNDESPGALLQGFTIQNGVAANGGGLALSGSSPTIIGNIFQEDTQTDGGCGAAIGGTNAAPLIEQNIFENNAADLNDSSGIVSFTGRSNPVIADNVFLTSSSCAVNLNVAYGSAPVVINNTIVSNSIGLHVSGDFATASQTYANNILFANTTGLAVDAGYPAATNGLPTWQHNLVCGGQADYVGIPDQAGLNGNTATNPYAFFACPPTGDFQLLPGSPCIDAGTNGVPDLPAVDIAGHPRLLAGNTNDTAMVDIGAYEFNPASPASPCLYLAPPTNVVAVAAAGQDSAVVNYPAPAATPLASVTCQPPSGSVFPAGTNLVTCTLAYGTNILTAAFTVTVLVPPFVTNQPAVISVPAGTNATIAVGIIGTAPISYQWLFDNAALAGATNASVTVSNAQAVNGGVYQVALTNAEGSAASLPMVLRVLPAPATVVSPPSSVSVSAGSTALLNATLGGSAPLLIQWYQNGALLPGANASPLLITNAQTRNAGSYTVTVSNALGTAISLPATLTVLPAKPTFVLQPASTAAVAGTGATFTSQAAGTDDNLHPIVYSWYFQNLPLAGQTGAQLLLPALAVTNAGNYFVVASNLYGSATSTVAQLTVYLPPAILSGLSNEVVTAGLDVTLGVTITGTPPLGFNWSLNGSPLTKTAAFLSFTNISASQSGCYVVTVTNQFGSASSTGRLSVLPPAGRVVAWGDDSGGQTEVPTNLDEVVAVAGGDYHSVALRQNGSLVAWGADDFGQTDVPTNALPFIALAAGADHNLAIAADGSIVGWGRDDFGQTDIPTNTVPAVSVAAGDSHSLALLSSGIVMAWGDDTYAQTDLPFPLLPFYYIYWWGGALAVENADWVPTQAIAAGRNHNLALLPGGTVVGWGDNGFGQASPPTNLTNAIAIAAGDLHSVALRSDGTVIAWGDNSFGQTNVPPGLTNVLAIAAGDFHTFALLANGRIVAWGDDTFSQTNVPARAFPADALASGYDHGLALVPAPALLYSRLAARRLVIQWHEPGTLQWAPTPAGPFADLPSPNFTYTNTAMSAPAKFFRLRR